MRFRAHTSLLSGLMVIAALAATCLVMLGSTQAYAANRNASPNLTKWLDTLPIPPLATPQVNPLYPGADYYEITMTQHTHQFHSKLGQATVRTYGENGQPAVYLGPTILAQSGKPVVVKYINLLPTNNFPLQASIDPTILGGTCRQAAQSRTFTAASRLLSTTGLPTSGGRLTV